MSALQPLLQQGQKWVSGTYQLMHPYVQLFLKHVLQWISPLLPFYLEAKRAVFVWLVDPVRPFVAQLMTLFAPVWVIMAQLTSYLPTFKGYPVNYVGIAAIVLHVLNYNITAQFEYKTKVMTKLFGKGAIYLNALYLIVSALIRDYYLYKAIERDAGSRILFEQETADVLSFIVIAFGVFLNLWVLKVLGWKNMYNGDSFGYLLSHPVTHGPYKYFDDPQYFGTTMILLGYAIQQQSRIGYGLTGVMYLAFSFSVMLVEGPHIKRIYAEKEKKKPREEKNKQKKNN